MHHNGLGDVIGNWLWGLSVLANALTKLDLPTPFTRLTFMWGQREPSRAIDEDLAAHIPYRLQWPEPATADHRKAVHLAIYQKLSTQVRLFRNLRGTGGGFESAKRSTALRNRSLQAFEDFHHREAVEFAVGQKLAAKISFLSPVVTADHAVPSLDRAGAVVHFVSVAPHASQIRVAPMPGSAENGVVITG